MTIDHAAMPTLSDIPSYFAVQRPDQVALVCDGRETDWATLARRTNQVANALLAEGVGPGDRVVTITTNSDEFIELMFGAARIGAVFTPIVHRLAVPEVTAIAADAGARLIFVGPAHIGDADGYAEAVGGRQHLIGFEQSVPGIRSFAEWRDSAPDTEPAHQPSEHDVALQLYTSGTTGKPKGVMLSHYNLLGSKLPALAEKMPWNEWQDGDINLVAMPNGHIGGVGWAIAGLFNGAKTLIQREFSPEGALDAMASGITKLFIVPAALQMLLLNPRSREIDYSRLRSVLYGASPIALDLLREATEVFGCGFCQQYGMTETTGTVVYLPPEDHDPAGTPRMRGAGKPLAGVEIRIVGEDGSVLGPHETGEIQVRSGYNMVGYHNRPEATAETVDSEGWLKTGDAGFLDEDGYLYIQDRIKDMIVSGGENVYPAEVESAIYGHPAIREIAVIGVPDPKWGEAVKAIVALRDGETATAEDIIAFARSRIAGFKVPKSVDFIDALPRNPSGKILRRFLREPYWEGHDRRVN